MRYPLITMLVAVLLPAAAYPQIAPAGDGTEVGAALARLEWARKNRPVESIHLHFDKPYYSGGDTIYFKAYVTLNEQHVPTPLSEVLHVDLIDPQDRIIRSMKLQLKQGCAFGDIGLRDSLAAGRYRVRAYTRWMLNEGAGAFFDAALAVGSAMRTAAAAHPVAADTSHTPIAGSADIQFFPEGGELVAGMETKVAFKVTGKNGLGIKAKGIVVDDAGKEITRFQAVHLGMGFFYLRPEAGRTYQAKLSFSDGSGGKADLSKAASQGMVLAVENDTLIHILTSDIYLQTHPKEPIAVLICSNGGSSLVKGVLSAGDIPIAVDKRRMHPGIARITLFSALGEPVSERLLFVRGPDSVHLTVQSDKPQYRKRDKVELAIATQHALGGAGQANLSVSVIDEDLLTADENNEKTILSDLLLSSELKGYVEQPNYYFAHSGDEVDANLDLLLLTQGYRHFVWKQVLRDNLDPVAYKAEKYLQIQGIVRATSGKAMVNEPITLTDTTGQGPDQKTMTDTAGRFAFTNLVFTDTMHFLLHPASSGSHVMLSGYIPPPVAWEPSSISADVNAMPRYLTIAAREHEIKGVAKAQVLKTVVVEGRKYYTQSLAGTGHADQVLHARDIHGGGSLGDALNGKLTGITIVRGRAILNTDLADPGKAHAMKIVIDGVEIDANIGLNSIPLTNVETVEVLRSANTSMYGINGGEGVLVITTKQGNELEAEEVPEREGLFGSFMGFYKSREFYTPRYTVADAGDKSSDLRTTVFWKPDIVTDTDGKASLSFYNSDLAGVYRVVIEGLDANGNPSRQVYRYVVQ